MPGARIAVIAVHGVADQKPYETAADVAKLLLAERGATPMAALAEERIVIDVAGTIPRPADPATHDAGVQLSAELTAGFEPKLKHAQYETVRYRVGIAGAAPEVDVYELYWADLSRLAPGVWRILSELYQLLFHLASLGHRVLEAAVRREPVRPRSLRGARRLAEWSLFMLSGPIFLFNVALLLIYLAIAGAFVPHQAREFVAAFLLVATAIAGAGIFLYGSLEKASPKMMAAGALVFVNSAALGIAFVGFGFKPLHITTFFSLAAATGLCWLLVDAFAERRPEVRLLGIAVVAMTSVALLVGLLMAFVRTGAEVLWPGEAATTGLRIVQFVMLLLFVSWPIKMVIDLLFGATSAWLYFRVRSLAEPQRTRIRTATKTAALGTMLSTAGFLLITLPLWSALLSLAKRAVGLEFEYTPWIGALKDEPIKTADFADRLVAASAGYFLPTLLIAIFLCVALLWAIAPSLIAEVSPKLAFRGSLQTSQRRLGRWLTLNLHWVAYAIAAVYMLYCLIGLVFLLDYASRLKLAVLDRFELVQPFVAFLTMGSAQATGVVGGLLAGTAVTLIALGNRLQDTVGKVRVALDILLDVDNYLRAHPTESNPRSLIFARYQALLGHVVGQAYERIVFVAHSQGTVITADFLRLVQASGAQPADAKWSFLSFGCPLRQLYAAHFAHWYAWIAAPASLPQLVKSLGLSQWMNAYGSGDYVGRRVFADNGFDDGFTFVTPSDVETTVTGSDSAEFCVAPLAHTHYVDGNARLVGTALVAMVR